jgi:histidyl-tRNA synthetase
MAEKKQFRAIKGVRDILPPDTALWNWFEKTAREVMEAYNFREIRLPVFEQTELFARSVGEDTDIVTKEMYTFADHPLRAIEALKSETRRRRLSRKESDLVRMTVVAREFLRQVDAALDDKEFPGTPENMSAVEDIRGALAQFEEGVRDSAFQDADILLYLADIMKSRIGEVQVGEVLTLRPEATASVVRAYIEHGMHTWPGDVKLYYVGPMFRRERPQKGRYRQFYQIGAEVLGQSDHPAIEAEVIEMLIVLFDRCRIERWTLLVNSIGCANCRPKYVEALRRALQPVKGKMCADCQRRAETNPLRVLDCKVPADQPIIARLPAIIDHLDPPCREHFEEFQRQLKLRGIPYTITPRLVRGLDYYTRTTFEITSPVLGAQNALVGGGRYDGLSELLGGPPAKGIGFALGEDRFVEAIQHAGKVDAAQPVDVFLAWIGEKAYPAAVRLARRLRGEGFSVELPAEEMKLKKSLGLADKLGARYALLLGEDELASGAYVLRRLADGEQKKLSETALIQFLKSAEKYIS